MPAVCYVSVGCYIFIDCYATIGKDVPVPTAWLQILRSHQQAMETWKEKLHKAIEKTIVQFAKKIKLAPSRCRCLLLGQKLPNGEHEANVANWRDLPANAGLDKVHLEFEWRLLRSTNGFEKDKPIQTETVSQRLDRVLKLGVPLPSKILLPTTAPSKKRKLNALGQKGGQPVKESGVRQRVKLNPDNKRLRKTDSEHVVDDSDEEEEHDFVRSARAAPFDSSDILLATQAKSMNECSAVPLPLHPGEATRLLSIFRPSLNTPQTLSTILNSKADPNIIAGDGAIHPLQNVIAFASKAHVHAMRQLLLEAGAQEDDEARKRWVTRCRADDADEAWMEKIHKDPDLVAVNGE